MNGLNDLNSIFGFGQLTLSRLTAKESFIESRSHRFCATHPVLITQRIQSLRGALWGPQEYAFVLLLGSVSHHGFRATYLSRELARHRSLSRSAAAQAISLRLQWGNQTFHTGRRQRETRLAHLPRFRSEFDSNSTPALCSFRVGARTGCHCLRLRRHHHRPLSLALSLGQVQTTQRRDQTTHAAGNSQCYSRLYCHYSRGCARSKPARRTHPRTRLIHCYGPRLRRFPTALSTAYGAGLLCHSHQRQSGFSPSLFRSARPQYRRAQRSNHCPDWAKVSHSLSARAAPRSLLLSRAAAATRTPNQQLFDSGINRGCTLSLPLANRIVLQMDQTASAHQKLLRHFRQQRQDPSMDRDLGLCADGNHQKTLTPEARSLHFVTGSQSYSFRQNTPFNVISADRIQSPIGP